MHILRTSLQFQTGFWVEGHSRLNRDVMFNVNAGSLSFTAPPPCNNTTLFESFLRARDQRCHRGSPNSRLDITSSLPLTPLLFSFLPSLSAYLFRSQNTMFPEHISLEYFTTCSRFFSRFSVSLSVCAQQYLFISGIIFWRITAKWLQL